MPASDLERSKDPIRKLYAFKFGVWTKSHGSVIHLKLDHSVLVLLASPHPPDAPDEEKTK
jgi:hypothetical protein